MNIDTAHFIDDKWFSCYSFQHWFCNCNHYFFREYFIVVKAFRVSFSTYFVIYFFRCAFFFFKSGIVYYIHNKMMGVNICKVDMVKYRFLFWKDVISPVRKSSWVKKVLASFLSWNKKQTILYLVFHSLDPISQVLMRFLLDINHSIRQESPQENNHYDLSYNNTTDALKGNIHLNYIYHQRKMPFYHGANQFIINNYIEIIQSTRAYIEYSQHLYTILHQY